MSSGSLQFRSMNFSLPVALSVENLIQTLPQVRHPRPLTKRTRPGEWDTPIYTLLQLQRSRRQQLVRASDYDDEPKD